ncbi:MAG: hypothetical protein KDA61_12900, partial [Planctomycetales bacterium]|nr:hypothetical protein [Planctomycetales bacterium]
MSEATTPSANVAEPSSPSQAAGGAASRLIYLNILLIGVYLGFLFTKTEVAKWERIHAMFLLQEADMYLIIGSAIVVATAAMVIINAFHVK